MEILTKRYKYLNNPKLKRADVEIAFSDAEITEYAKCKRDIVYFAQNFIQIVHVDKGKIPIDLFPYQKKVLRKLQKNRFNVLNQARQSGKSTVVVIFLLWYILFHDYKYIGILANKGKTAKQILGRLKLAYENLPLWLQQGVVEWNKESIELENGSRVLSGATSSSAVRGESFSCLFVDELAFVNPNIWEEFYSATYPTVSSGTDTKIIFVSTPNGLNHFYRICMDAINENSTFVYTEVKWNKVPGRGAKWRKETIANTSEDQFDQEHKVQFLGNSKTLISSGKLKSMAALNPIYDNREGLRLYKEPEEGHQYAIVVDVSRGKGLDSSAFSIIDITETPYNQVGAYKNSTISPLLYPNVILAMAKQYNEAMVLIEVNDIGEQVANILNYDLEYENVLMFNDDMGIRTTKSVRSMGCSTMKDMIENEMLIINDESTIIELSGFVIKGGKYQADDGFHDDLVMSLVLFSWLTTDNYFKEITDQDIKARMFDNQMKQIEEDLTPFGIVNDGQIHNDFDDDDGLNWYVDEDFGRY